MLPCRDQVGDVQPGPAGILRIDGMEGEMAQPNPEGPQPGSHQRQDLKPVGCLPKQIGGERASGVPRCS